MPVTHKMVRNTTPGPAVFSDGTNQVEWWGKGDPMHRDVQPVPDVILDNVQFGRMLIRGVFSLEEDEKIVHGIQDAHRAEFAQQMARQQSASLDALDQIADNDTIMVGCVGPAANGRGSCGVQLPVKARARAEKPPLCPEHGALAGQYVSRESTDRVVGGKPEIVWEPIQIDTRTRQN